MKVTTLDYFKTSIWFTVVCLTLAGVYGWFQGGTDVMIAFLVSCFALALLETSVSLDNAVVNAKILRDVNEESKKWFLTWGIVIAVFGLRILFPILIICIAAWVDPLTATILAVTDPVGYQTTLQSANVAIMGFGSAFLLLVAIEFFCDAEKEDHWIPGLEHAAAFIGKFPHSELLIGLPLILLAGATLPEGNQTFVVSGIGGMLTWYFVHGVKALLEDTSTPMGSNVTTGLMIGPLLYLECVDASFSLDGVLAAVAVTNNFIIIALGLGIGAMFVRSMTIYMVDKGTLGTLRYLEHGAFFGIAWLVYVMYQGAMGQHMSEILAAGVAAVLIGLAGLHSWYLNKKESIN